MRRLGLIVAVAVGFLAALGALAMARQLALFISDKPEETVAALVALVFVAWLAGLAVPEAWMRTDAQKEQRCDD